MEKREIIFNFIKNFCKREDILGTVFYGSSCYKTDNPGSDIDLLFITDGDKNYKGTTYIDGIKIEYFEKNIYYLMKKIETLPFSSDRSLVSIFKNGKILYSKNQAVEYLKEEILSTPKLFQTKKKKRYYELDFIEFYEQIQLLNYNNTTYPYIYYNLLESIRKRYHEEHGYSKIPNMKIYSLYTNIDYAREFYCIKLPDKNFRDCYLNMSTNLEELDKVKSFMNYIDCSFDENKILKKFYNKNELKYLSTIVRNMIDKTLYYSEINYPSFISCYYITLERIRRLYCYINQIEDKISFDNEKYDIRFLELFNSCIYNLNNSKCLEELFQYVVESLQMNYKNYKVLELSY